MSAERGVLGQHTLCSCVKHVDGTVDQGVSWGGTIN